MTDQSLPRRRAARTGDPEVDHQIEALLDAVGATANRDQLFDILSTAVLLARDHTDRLDLKIASSALREMRAGFLVFTPHRAVPKVTMFGSARTLPTDPLYRQARDLASTLAGHGWSTVTGAGPGIMAAGLEGAGPDHSFGINIELPFEAEPNEFIAANPNLVSMKYFFTRKLLLVKESDGFVVLPGGFGTLDEEFELLTLLQTGKAAPAPLVLLEVPGGTYWQAWEHWITTEVAPRGLINAEDLNLYRITDNVDDAAGEILGFYRNYHSLRFFGHTLVIRLRSQPTAAELAELSAQFADLAPDGGLTALGAPLPAEAREDDHPDLPRIALRFRRIFYGRLRLLIDALNALPSAPPPAAVTGGEGFSQR
ncbi:MAG: LOG family protein [Acidimicrobiales bacterium]